MGKFLYFLPDEDGAGDATLERFGLQTRFRADNSGLKHRGARVGLDGDRLVGPDARPENEMAGVVVTLGDRVGFYPAEQTWEQVAADESETGEVYWLGMWTDDTPGPDDLAHLHVRLLVVRPAHLAVQLSRFP